MHDETFLVTKGTVRFHVPETPGLTAQIVDANEGDYVVVPTRAPHTFSNETDEEARFINTFTPVSGWSASAWEGALMLTAQAFYIHYFKLLSSLIAEGKEMTPEVNKQAMAYYATIPVQK
jgi:oxalate decarboxylase/phosphoglucose isomerase-like protein (cupin superfamily)